MRPLTGKLCPLVLATLFVASSAPHASTPAPAAPAGARGVTPGGPSDADVLPGAGLRIVRTQTYRMAGRIRPLLFWFGRDNVGLGRVVWREGPDDARGYDLLVGTDPSRAPRGLNRWGFISEATTTGAGTLLALMTRSDEASVEEVKAAADHPDLRGDFRAIRSRTFAGTATWRLSSVQTPQPLTVHDLDAALDWVGRTPSAVPRERAVTADLRPGLLTSVAAIVDQATRSFASTGSAAAVEGRRVGYVFGQRTYDLRLRDTTLTTGEAGGRVVRALLLRFETRARDTRDTSTFDLVCGVDGRWTGVPLLIEWQPRWWLKVSLHLDESQDSTRSASR